MTADKPRERDASAKRYATDFIRILVPEIEPSLKANKVPVTREAKIAFMVGVEVSQRLSTELFNQLIMDLGSDPAYLVAMKARAEGKNLGEY